MPVYKGKEFIEEIDKGKESIKRTYKSKDLTYGLYDLKYRDQKSTDTIYIPKKGEISKYAWGKNRYLPPKQGNDNFDDYFEEYKTHWYGWYDDINYEEERPKWSDTDRYYIDYTEKQDYELFAKWDQKRFEYSGELWYEEKNGGGGSNWTPRYNAPYEGELNYKTVNQGGNNAWYQATGAGPEWPGCVMPNCTGWVWGRYLDNGINLGPGLVSPMSGGDCTPLWNAYPDRQSSYPNNGSIACWTTHLAIVESINGDSATITWSNWNGAYWKTASPLISNIPNYGGSGTFLGYLLYPEPSPASKSVSKSSKAKNNIKLLRSNPMPLPEGDQSYLYSFDQYSDCAAWVRTRKAELGITWSANMYTCPTSSNPTPGCIAIWWPNGNRSAANHVAFVEAVNNGQPLYSHGGWHVSENSIILNVTYRSGLNDSLYTVGYCNSGDGSSSDITPTGPTGEVETWDWKNIQVNYTECEDQNNPSEPDAETALAERGIHMDDSHRNPKWDPLNRWTSQRTFDYYENKGGEWPDEWGEREEGYNENWD